VSPWAKLDDGFTWNGKVVEAGNEAAGVYVRALAHCAAQLTDGFVAQKIARSISEGRKQPIAALVEAELWVEVDGGYQIPDFLDYNPSREQKLEERAEARDRMRRVRENRSGRSPERSDEQTPNVRENFGERSATPSRTRPQRPSPTQSENGSGGKGPPPEDQVRAEFQRWVGVHEEATGSKPIPSELKLAEANFRERRSEGVSVDDLERAARVASADRSLGLSPSQVLSRFKLGPLLAAPKPKKSAFPELERNATEFAA
jgi:hypothetical protein